MGGEGDIRYVCAHILQKKKYRLLKLMYVDVGPVANVRERERALSW